MEDGIGKLKSTLKQAGSSVTKSRSAVFTYLSHHGPLYVGQLAEALEDQLDRATTYRTIELFEKLGIVNRIWHGFKHQVELSEIFTPHHHHARCQHCGRIQDIASPELEAELAKIAKKHDFIALEHSVELTGYCRKCQ
jgi:Fur family ferric uptake transcriptional regulator